MVKVDVDVVGCTQEVRNSFHYQRHSIILHDGGHFSLADHRK